MMNQTQVNSNLDSNVEVIEFSEKQAEFMEHCYTDPYKDYRWYGKTGATRCGKTTLDIYWTIPFRIAARRGMQGLVCMTGVSLGTIGRNILEPMRNYWKYKRGYFHVIGETKKDANGNIYVMIFGSIVYLIGMVDKKAIAKLRGAEFKYVYCDELAECNEEAFNLLKSRLSLPYSCCDFTCNPESTNHWLYKFIQDEKKINEHAKLVGEKEEMYLQEYTLFDNPFLDDKVVESLCREYQGVWYERYVLGHWCRAEGCIYSSFVQNEKSFIVDEIPKMLKINIGVDFSLGGEGSWSTFVATGFGYGYNFAIHLESEKIPGDVISAELAERFVKFVNMVKEKYREYLPIGSCVFRVYCDSADQIFVRDFKVAQVRNHLPVIIEPVYKMEINQRIKLQTKLLGLHKLLFYFTATNAIRAYSEAVWDSREGHEDERLDNHETNAEGMIDTLDAAEYSLTPEYKNLANMLE